MGLECLSLSDLVNLQTNCLQAPYLWSPSTNIAGEAAHGRVASQHFSLERKGSRIYLQVAG